MAEFSDSTPAPGANPPDAFDAATWLNSFRAVGGWWIVNAEGKVTLGWHFKDKRDPWGDAPRAFYRDLIAAPDHLAAVEERLRARRWGVRRPSRSDSAPSDGEVADHG